VLSGESAERAASVVHEIADVITSIIFGERSRRVNHLFEDERIRQALIEPGLCNGCCGLAVFFTSLDRLFPDTRYAEASDRLLASALDNMARAHGASLYTGYSGVAWTMSYLIADPADSGTEEYLQFFDGQLLDLIQQPDHNLSYEPFSGLVGIGLYALRRLPRPEALEILNHILDNLLESALHDHDGASWMLDSPPGKMRDMYPDGNTNCGLAHGMPSVMVFLSALYMNGLRTADTRELLDDAVHWLLAQEFPAASRCRFPAVVDPAGEKTLSRLAWCYGDPGVAAALLIAARCTGEQGWYEKALEVADDAAQRQFEDSGVVDAPLCHGASGLALIFSRLYNYTGFERHALAARRWYDHTLSLRVHEDGIAGYRTYRKEGAITDPQLLNGAAGIGLSLLAGISEHEPSWDQFMMLSLPSVHPISPDSR